MGVPDVDDGCHGRCGGSRGRAGRLRRCLERCSARCPGGSRREGETRRHLSECRLHPHQSTGDFSRAVGTCPACRRIRVGPDFGRHRSARLDGLQADRCQAARGRRRTIVACSTRQDRARPGAAGATRSALGKSGRRRRRGRYGSTRYSWRQVPLQRNRRSRDAICLEWSPARMR